MRDLFSLLILPLPIFWILVILALILSKRKIKTSRIILGISFFWLLLISTPLLPNLIVKSLESRYGVVSTETIGSLEGNVNILVLGGGHTYDKKLPANSQLTESALARLTEGIRLHRLIKQSVLITSGYGGISNVSNAEILAKTAILIGVKPSNIKLQKSPENTLQEAIEYKKNFGDSTKLILVTSAVHMPRAMYLFHKTGLNPIAAPTKFLLKKEKNKDGFNWIPSSQNIHKLEKAIYEYVGLLWYFLGGY